jgi:hypothetical protein
MRKATTDFVIPVCLSVCPSVRMKQLGSHWTDFYEIWYMSIFRKSAERIQVSLKSDKNNGHFTWRHTYVFYTILMNCSYNEKSFGSFREIKTQFYFYLFKKIASEIVPFMTKCGKILQSLTVQRGLRPMQIACWVTKAKIQTHTQNIQ